MEQALLERAQSKPKFSDKVSASATASQSQVTLIDPFQLVDYKTRIVPHHMYPQFKLILDKFNDTNQSQDTEHDKEIEGLPPLEELDTTTYSQQEYEQEQNDLVTRDQVLQQDNSTT